MSFGANGLFVLHDLTGREHIRFESVDCDLAAADVLDGVAPASAASVDLPV